MAEIPKPGIKSGSILIETSKSLVSLGPKKCLLILEKQILSKKAKQQPDKVKMVLDKAKTDGLRPTMEAVFNKLGQPLPLGYCNVGKVIKVGNGVTEFNIGDRVVSNGNHAEFVCVPKNLAAKKFQIMLQMKKLHSLLLALLVYRIRLLNPTFGETIVVVGLGLIGLITAELLKANGCNVIGFDFDAQKIAIAKEKGITAMNPSDGTNQVKFVESITNGIGADGVIITASNKSNEIISQSAQMCRKKEVVLF